MKKLATVLVICLFSAVGCNHLTQRSEPGSKIPFINHKGEVVKVDFSSDGLMSEQNKREYIDLGASIVSSQYLCSQKLSSEKSKVKSLEIELELKNIIDSLEQTRKRKLTETQLRTIYKTPICFPFVDELKVITMQLDGYKILRNNYKSSSL